MLRFRNKKKLTDSEIILLCKEDTNYFEVLYERYFTVLFRFIYQRIGNNEAVSGDLTQQVFLKALLNIEKYEDRGFPFSSWLYRIAINEINLFFRANKKTCTVEVEERKLNQLVQETSSSSKITSEEQEQLIQLLSSLPQEQVELIELRFFQELSFKEIAQIYNMTEANAKMKIYRILDKLKLQWK